MSKRAVILHGTDGHPSQNWQPWLRQQFEDHGYAVLTPELPSNHTPDLQIYGDFLFSKDWDFSDNILVGHSSGATEVLNLLMDDRCPRVKAAVLVASFLQVTDETRAAEWFEPGQFDNTFPSEGFDWEKIRSKCGAFYFVHGSNDEYCPVELAAEAAEKLGAEILVIEGGGHLGGNSGIIEIPGIINMLKADTLL